MLFRSSGDLYPLDRLVRERLGRLGKWDYGSGTVKIVEVQAYLVKVANEYFIVSQFRPQEQHEDTNIQLSRKSTTLAGIRVLPNDNDPICVFSIPEWYCIDVGLEEVQ